MARDEGDRSRQAEIPLTETPKIWHTIGTEILLGLPYEFKNDAVSRRFCRAYQVIAFAKMFPPLQLLNKSEV